MGILGNEAFPEFLRVYWNSCNRIVRKTELFKVIRTRVRDRESAFGLIRQLVDCARIYAAIRDPNDGLWNDAERDHLANLKLYNVRQHYPLLLAAYRKWGTTNRSDFTRVLRSIDILSFRYNVICNFQTNEQERVYSQIAVKLSEGRIQAAGEVKQALASLYPDDEVFKAAVEKKALVTTNSRNRRIVRKILFQVEKHLSGQDFEFESDKYNVEHVLPENPGDEWCDYDENAEEDFIYRLGNLTLMAASENRDLGNVGYETKRSAYESSVFAITRKIAEDYAEWNSDKIVARQNWLARQVVMLWRVEF